MRGLWYALLLLACPAHAKLEDVEKQLKKSQANFVQSFTQFTQDKNFMGRPRNPDGNVVQGTRKTAFNQDDKGPFQSDLTYHDLAYEIEDQAYAQKIAAAKKAGQDPKGVSRRYIYAGISDHGAISAAGGSSQLERVGYQLYDQFAKLESEKEKDEDDQKKGFQYRGVFKVETQEVKKDKKGGGKGANDKDTAPEKVERWSLREEAAPPIAQVGTNSFQTLEKAAVGENNPPNALPNLAYYYEAANQALVALWNSTLGNLGQRRGWKAVNPKDAPGNVELSQSQANCQQWGQASIAKIDPKSANQDKQKEDIQRMVQQCQQIAKVSYREITPRFEKPDNAGGGGGGGAAPQEELVMKGPEDEDPRERDWRVKLNTLSKVSTQAEQVQSNWKYTAADNQSKVTTGYDQSGQAVETQDLRMIDQVQKYNGYLKDSSDAIAEVKARFSGMPADPKAPLQFLKTGDESAMEITKFPEQAGVEGFETPVGPAAAKPAENYQDLVDGKGLQ